MHPAELRDLHRRPTVQAVTPRQRLDYPHIHGKRLVTPGAKKQDAIGDLFADAGEQAQPLLRRRVGQALGFGEPAGMCGEKLGRLQNEAGTETERAGAETGFTRVASSGQAGRRWRSVTANVDVTDAAGFGDPVLQIGAPNRAASSSVICLI
jgi:hypothetical protein